MKIMTIVGARPNFMKAAPVLAAIEQRNCISSASPEMPIESILVHTGQHYDAQMSDSFFRDLGMPRPDIHLCAGSGSHATQTAEIMRDFEVVLAEYRPDVVAVVGDVNSTIACALVAAKYTYPDGRRARIAHIEAGLRSFDRSMPEEVNRILTDHLADLLFVTEASGLRNLEREGTAPEKCFLVGNTMIDTLLAHRQRAESSMILDALGLKTPYAVLTLHRPANVDHRDPFLKILEGLIDLAATHPIVFCAHPRTRKRIEDLRLGLFFQAADVPASAPGIHLIEPLGYLDFLKLMSNARVVITDSGGIQEETTCLGVPCVTARENTERPVTVEAGTNILAGVDAAGIRRAIREQLQAPKTGRIPDKWDGRSATRIVDILAQSVTSDSAAAAA